MYTPKATDNILKHVHTMWQMVVTKWSKKEGVVEADLSALIIQCDKW